MNSKGSKRIRCEKIKGKKREMEEQFFSLKKSLFIWAESPKFRSPRKTLFSSSQERGPHQKAEGGRGGKRGRGFPLREGPYSNRGNEGPAINRRPSGEARCPVLSASRWRRKGTKKLAGKKGAGTKE